MTLDTSSTTENVSGREQNKLEKCSLSRILANKMGRLIPACLIFFTHLVMSCYFRFWRLWFLLDIKENLLEKCRL